MSEREIRASVPPTPRTFVERIFEHLEANPSRPFVTEVHGDRLERTFGGRLREMVGQARGRLREHGLEAGDRVGLCGPNSARWIALDLALLAEGLCVVPLYDRQAPAELAAMVEDAGCKAVCVATDALGEALAEAIGEGAPPTLPFEALLDGPSLGEAPYHHEAGELVTLIYTSGTSGKAKGVRTTAGNVDFMLALIDERLTELLGRPGGRDRVFHYLPFCFAGSRYVLWGNLFRGNGIMVSTDLTNLLQEIGTAAPEWFLNVPTLLERIRKGVDDRMRERAFPIRRLYEIAVAAAGRRREGSASMRDLLTIAAAKRLIFRTIRQRIGPQLRCLLCGSAPLSAETQGWFDLLDLPVYQVYGLTETTAIVSMDRPGEARPGTVGFAIQGVDIDLGEQGELLVKGPNIFDGYWELPEETAAAFTEDGWFRTGDQVVLDEDGRLRIIGRVKNLLVPESGHNVAPEPLEEALLEHVPEAEQAVVVGHGRPFLAAIVTGERVTEEAMARGLDALNATLPFYRRIRAFHLADETLTPESGLLTANQKLKRRAIESHFAEAIDRLYAEGPR